MKNDLSVKKEMSLLGSAEVNLIVSFILYVVSQTTYYFD